MIKTGAHISTRLAWFLLILFGMAGVAGCSAFRLPNDNFEDVDVPVIDTGLEQTREHWDYGVGVWLGNDRLAINTVQENPAPKAKRPFRVAVFDLRTKRITSLVEKGQLVCRDERSGIASILTNPEVDGWVKNGNYEYFKINESGQMSPDKDHPDWKHLCSSDNGRDSSRLQFFLREGDGFIDYGRTGGGASAEFAILYRPNQSPLTLPVRGGEINYPLYVEHRNEYLIGQSKRFSSAYTRPFRFMTPDGKVREVEYPQHFYDKIGPSSYMWPMRTGMLFDRTSWNQGVRGLFLVDGQKIRRVFGADGAIVERITPSPDGCKLAFLSFRQGLFPSKRTVKIINLCEKQ